MRLKFDALISHDITFVGIIQTAKASGLTKFPIPYAMTNCHNSLCAVGGTINEDDHAFGLSAAKKYGGIYVPPNQAVIHQYAPGAAGGLRQDDPGLRLPHPLRRLRLHGRGRGRRRAGQAAAGEHLRRGRPGGGHGVLRGQAPEGRGTPGRSHRAGGGHLPQRRREEQGAGIRWPRREGAQLRLPHRRGRDDHGDKLPDLHLADRRGRPGLL